MSEPEPTPIGTESNRRRLIVPFALAVIVAAAIFRSGIATSLDTFNLDEAYHIGAGVSYIETGDYRLNPEHPPLIKLWVGAWQSVNGFVLSPYRPLNDKFDERFFVQEDVYNNNDPTLVLHRARQAMLALNGILLFLFGLSVRFVFGDLMAFGSVGYLAIDPTVAAHLPVVMTDLPVALTSASAIILAVHALRFDRSLLAVIAGLALGLALGSKHSAIIAAFCILLIGVGISIFLLARKRFSEALQRSGLLTIIGIVSLALLWATYSFSFYETPNSREDNFNRPLSEKIGDVRSPSYRAGLSVMANGYLVPRAYTWGLADTIRAGAEGRVNSQFAFGNLYYGSAPWFYGLGIIGVKVPLGLLFLTVLGIGLLLVRSVPRDFHAPLIGYSIFAAVFLFFLIQGSSYGGVRHVLPIFPLLALFASTTVYVALGSRSYLLGGVTIFAVGLSAVSAIPVIRPWEYFNETVGGTYNAHKYFDDEGVDLYQRGGEAVSYYHDVLKPAGEIPYVFYILPEIKDPSKTVDQVSSRNERDRGKWDGPTATGTFIVGANEIAPRLWWDRAAFRDAQPVARFGNLFVFRGTFDIQPMRAQGLYHFGKRAIYSAEPQIERGIGMLAESLRLDPRAFFVGIELGNQYLMMGRTDDALRAYETALANTPAAEPVRTLLERQIERLRAGDKTVATIRNPESE